MNTRTTALKTRQKDAIPNIHIGQVYDQRYIEADIHYERLENLADFFGRNMPVHYHDRFYQLHVVLSGTVRVHLDEVSYSARAPMFFLTPPTVPHAFITDDQASGHVITVRQQLIWEMLGGIDQPNSQGVMSQPLCVELQTSGNDAAASRMLQLLEMMSAENNPDSLQHARAQQALLQLVLIDISRLADQGQPQQNTQKEDVRVFHRFNELIENHFREHLTLDHYADQIGVTEARLNNICRRLAGQPSKRLIMDRLVQEARRLLTYSTAPVTEIGYHLGFKDPAYFARFFRRNTGVTASEYRDKRKNL
ncbi:4-hydroxyphenylacetate catabolism regulatory protein HpaA [Aliamphritea spongicola]|uniref:4-hydroxyphenylacetate catabolism regulatory protein HpaA n=1 Tax=Aliamphritea spongicola TaxID=707589 RepID=UPI00196A254A|nr:4-hydroxyphenylacetate catabolism regulatory protein HpaA [Aliamphritea spongicola]MBN3560918.1 4-hydroxyphenylacetate catabolism regulatory protein HpaA [Aliamphritea spongicola]